jgi:hypothetical protein
VPAQRGDEVVDAGAEGDARLFVAQGGDGDVLVDGRRQLRELRNAVRIGADLRLDVGACGGDGLRERQGGVAVGGSDGVLDGGCYDPAHRVVEQHVAAGRWHAVPTDHGWGNGGKHAGF